ncbi:MAG: chromate efflux transporter [Gemmatimonadetes bacterium]|nr:chromate efflux transporter [Gemmatimonadota bacterium]
MLRDLALLFLKLGSVAFGGPAAHIAMMEDEVVRRRGWLSRAAFLDLVGATNLIPGPNSTELAIHIGHARAGWRGLLVAGCAFILPATLMVGGIAWAYVRFGALPQVEAVLYGVKPVVIAVVLQAVLGLGRSALKSPRLVLVSAASAALVVLGVHELVVLLLAAAAMGADHLRTSDRHPPTAVLVAIAPASPLASPLVHGGSTAAAATGIAATAATAPAWSLLFWLFAKIGAVLFGSGYVLLAFLRSEFVHRLGWLSEQQLLDAVAVGQITPGPVFTTATFIGYVLRGPAGAVAATAGIFAPAFLFVALSVPVLPRLRRSRLTATMLDGVNSASLALIAVVAVTLARAALVDVSTIVLAALGALLLIQYRINSAWLVLGGAAAGGLLSVLR